MRKYIIKNLTNALIEGTKIEFLLILERERERERGCLLNESFIEENALSVGANACGARSFNIVQQIKKLSYGSIRNHNFFCVKNRRREI